MSDTKTLGEQLKEARKASEEAQFLASQEIRSLENRLHGQAIDYNALQQDPDYQQAMLAQWKHWCEARRASGLSIEEFIRARWEEKTVSAEVGAVAGGPSERLRILNASQSRDMAYNDAAHRLTLALYPNAEKTQNFEASLKEVRALVVASEMRQHAAKAKALADTGGGPPPAPCSCGAMQACERCPELQVTPEVAAYIKTRAEDDAKLMGLNSVARGESDPAFRARAKQNLEAAIRALTTASDALGAVGPWAGDVYGERTVSLANEVGRLAERAVVIKLVIAP